MSTRSEKETVQLIMSRKTLYLSPRRRTIDALDLMIQYDVGSIMVVDRGKLEGIITERDIVRRITRDFDYLQKLLRETCSRPVISVEPNTQIWEAFALLLRNKIRRLPVVKAGRLVGILTERDLFKWVVRVAYEPNIPEDLKKLVSRSR